MWTAGETEGNRKRNWQTVGLQIRGRRGEISKIACTVCKCRKKSQEQTDRQTNKLTTSD